MRSFLIAFALMSGLPTTGACHRSDTRVEFYFAQGYHFTPAERIRIERVTEQTAQEVRQLLPSLPHGLLVRVYAGTDVIPETGETGSPIQPATIIWTVDPHHDGGVIGVVNGELRASLFHEFHHLVRYASVPSHALMDEVIAEGMASVFEDFAGPRRPWAAYGPEVGGWLKEIKALPPQTPRKGWFGWHADGRRWIGHHVGAYVTDRATQRSGKSAATLATMPTADVLRLAGDAP